MSDRATVSISPSPLWTWLLVGPPAVLCLLPPLLAANAGQLWYWMSGALVLGGLGVTHNRITLTGDVLAVRGALLTKRTSLTTLHRVQLVPGAGRYHTFWEMRLHTSDGNSRTLRLNGFSPPARQKLLAALAPFVNQPGVHHEGPVTDALANRLWFPNLKRQA